MDHELEFRINYAMKENGSELIILGTDGQITYNPDLELMPYAKLIKQGSLKK